MQLLLQEWVVAGSLAILFFLVVVFEIIDDLAFLVLREHFHLGCLGLRQLHPWILQDLLRRQSLDRIGLQDFLQNRQAAFTYIARRAPTALHIDDLLLQFTHVCCLEWHCSEEHGIEDNPCAPNVRLEAAVALAFEDLRGDVSRRAALLGLQLVPALDELGHSEVADWKFEGLSRSG